MGKHTSGTAEVRKTEKNLYVVGGSTEFGRPTICDMPTMANGAPCEHAEADAALIADAFNVAAETGLTPRELAGQRERLLAALKAARRRLDRLDDASDLGPSDEYKQVEAAIAEAEGATP